MQSDLGLTAKELDDRTVCVYWDPVTNEGEGGWSSSGCKIVGRDDDSHVTCECNHLSSFAILVVRL